jgi:peptide chain release factor subunit 3
MSRILCDSPALTVGILGHVDCGKTLLLQRLTDDVQTWRIEGMTRVVIINNRTYSFQEKMLRNNPIFWQTNFHAVILVISAQKGAFELGIEKGGQTRGDCQTSALKQIKHMLIVVNKMDLVEWNPSRYNEIVEKMSLLLESVGFPTSNITFIPCSAAQSHFIHSASDWYKGPSIVELLSRIPTPTYNSEKSLRIPVSYGIDSTMYGTIEQGTLVKGERILVPPDHVLTVDEISIENQTNLLSINAGHFVTVRFKEKNIPIKQGDVISGRFHPPRYVQQLIATLFICDQMDTSVVSAGWRADMIIHQARVECTLRSIMAKLDEKGEKIGKPRFAKKGDRILVILDLDDPVCLEKYCDLQAMGSIELMHNGILVAIGQVSMLKPQHYVISGFTVDPIICSKKLSDVCIFIMQS